MYFPYFIAYISIGLLVSGVALFWALRHKQFSDQQRARFLPLENDPAPTMQPPSRWHRVEIWALILLAAGGLACSAAVLVTALLRG